MILISNEYLQNERYQSRIPGGYATQAISLITRLVVQFLESLVIPLGTSSSHWLRFLVERALYLVAAANSEVVSDEDPGIDVSLLDLAFPC